MVRTKIDSRAIVMLLFGLVAVVAIMMQMRRSLPQPPPYIAQLGGRIGIVDSVYINLPFRFMLKMPKRNWTLTMLSQDTLFKPFMPNENVQDQIQRLVAGVKCAAGDTLARVDVGILVHADKKDSHEFAIHYLAELIAHYESDVRVRILQQVTSPAHQVLNGDYFAIVVPDAKAAMPVLVYAVLPRADLFYIINMRTTESDYPVVRREFEAIVQGFYPLPSTIN